MQKHDARTLHFDFRLEHDGVLLSWAVPKGPSLDPRDRRLAVQVEDHPLDYAAFEGEIPPGQYGAGRVDLWDRGRWIPHQDVARGLARGKLDFRLLDGRLAGEWHLVRLASSRDRPAPNGTASWLLLRGKRRRAERKGGAKPRRSAAAPAAAGSGTEVAGVRVTHPDRLLFPEGSLTKLDLVRYLDAIWPRLEPHLRDRPVAFVRCPEGARRDCFFQKHWRDPPPGADPVDVSEPGEKEAPHLVVRRREGLAALAQNGVVEIHLWGSRRRRLERPDRLVFDLDPGVGVAWRDLVAGARALRALLAKLGLESFALLTGGKGVHVVAPLRPAREWAEVRAFAASIARALAGSAPDRYLARATKKERRGRIFVDYLRNGRGATAVAPYSPRARAHAPVATPIAWEELARSSPARWTISTVPARIRALRRDPWTGYFELDQTITRDALATVGLAAPARARNPGRKPLAARKAARKRRYGKRTKATKGKK